MLGLEDSSTIRSDTALVGLIMDFLMTHNDRSIRREMTLDEIGLKAEQSALKLAQDAKYLYDAVIKVDKAFKKKAEAYNNVVAVNKTLEEDSLALKQTVEDTMKRAEQLERKWSEADLKLIKKERELEAFRLDYAKVFGERDTIVIEKNELHAKDWTTPEPSDEEEGGQEDMEITSGEDEPNDGGAPPANQPEAPILDSIAHVNPNQKTSNNSFEEAMRLPSNEEASPSQTSNAVDADAGGQD
ncbi:hypothetical protein FNV43_RR11684 [Rhamnella rubrinervis]|uniref:Uncharacterized protein n=1 Tax=Rhamnella rubrinervis TaxID=2594499 RepID=A0A8K0H6S5_9ROSA|nr:hypothetical protein FNV43_RR11684 [Rhamnella rubrinervis]